MDVLLYPIPPHFPPFPPRFPPFSPISPRFPPFPRIFPHFPHFSVAQKRLGDSGPGDFQGLLSTFRAPKDPKLTLYPRGHVGPPGIGCLCKAPLLAASVRHSPLRSPFFLIRHRRSRQMTKRRM